MTLTICVLWGLTALALLLACSKIEHLQKDLRDEEDRHEMCHAKTEAAISKRAAKKRPA